MNVNLLPFEFTRRRVVRSITRLWFVIGAALIVVAIPLLIPEYQRLQKLHGEFSKIKALNAPIHKVLDDKTEIENQIKVLENEKAVLAKVLPDQRVMSILAILSQSVRDAEGKMQIQRFGFTTNYIDEVETATVAPSKSSSRKPAQNKEVVTAQPVSTLNLNGVALDDRSVGKFVEGLKAKGVFSSVDLKSCSESNIQGKLAWTFSVECRQ
jgi:Tfp pilus assembly protein PilN